MADQPRPQHGVQFEPQRGDDHAGDGRPSHGAVVKGYEPDVLNVRAIVVISAAILVILFGTFGIAYGIFAYTDKLAMENGKISSKAGVGLYTRLEGIGKSADRDEPRLDGLRKLQTEQPYVRPNAAAEGNPPSVTAADLRPEHQEALGASGWVDPNKTVARIPIEDAIKFGVKSLPTAQGGKPLTPPSGENRTNLSNGGRGAEGRPQ